MVKIIRHRYSPESKEHGQSVQHTAVAIGGCFRPEDPEENRLQDRRDEMETRSTSVHSPRNASSVAVSYSMYIRVYTSGDPQDNSAQLDQPRYYDTAGLDTCKMPNLLGRLGRDASIGARYRWR